MKLPTTLNILDFHKLTTSMFKSNHYLVINTDFGEFDIVKLARDNTKVNDITKVTIKSIEVRLPQFSIGDTVMIVDTGEMGIIGDIEKFDIYQDVNQSVLLVSIKDNSNEYIGLYHVSQIVQIPTDLINLLQS